MEKNLSRAALAAIASVVALVPMAGCTAPAPAPTPSAPVTGTTRSSGSAAPSSSATASAASYRDGTYNAIGTYGGGPSYLDVTVTLAANVITAVTVKPMAENETSRGFQERFAAAVPDAVIGKSVDEVRIGKLAGASTCGDGFNDALAKIRDQARAN